MSASANASAGLVETAIIELARLQPELGQARVAAALVERGLTISPSGVRHIWQRHDLETTYKRIKAIADQSVRARARLTERQVRLLARGDAGERGARRARRQRPTVDEAGPDRRRRILVAAADRFAKDGYAGSSLRDIGSQIGLLPGSIYHHFRTKDDLFLAVHREGFAQLIDRVTRVVATIDDPWQRLEKACAEHIAALVAGDTIARLTGASFFSSYAPRMKARLKPDRDRYEALFRRMVADLELPKRVDRTVFRVSLLGALNWTHVWYRPGRLGPEAIAAQLVRMLRG